MKLSRVLRPLLFALAVCVVVWACVVFWWTVAEVEPTGRQMLLWLGVLPAALLAGWWTTRFAIRRARRRREQPAADGAKAAVVDDAAVDTVPAYRLTLLASALHLPTGGDAAGALDAARHPAALRLHPALRDHRGLPVMCAFVDDLDADPVRDELAGHGIEPSACSDEQARAIALLDGVADALLVDLLAMLPEVEHQQERVIAGVRRQTDAAPRDSVRIRLLLSQGWLPPLRQAVGDRLLSKSAELGLSAAANTTVEIVPVTGGAQVWRLIDQLGRLGDGDRDWNVLFACDSLIGERSIDALQASGLLAGSERPEGMVPGEGAAGLVLRSATAPLPRAESIAHAVSLHTIVRADTAATQRARDTARTSSDLLLRALKLAGIDGDQLGAVLSDADQRPSRLAEGSVAATQAFPDAEQAEQYAALAAACGYLGHVAPLALLSTASAWVRQSSRAVIALAVSGIDARAAVTLSPLSPPTQDAGTAPDASA